ncbi:hypothetical protein CDIK_1224 [Cucumispora dikerogammari]|nr:hypothetical protein CDIK_1224 [Cucumispora dikerogammari]
MAFMKQFNHFKTFIIQNISFLFQLILLFLIFVVLKFITFLFSFHSQKENIKTPQNQETGSNESKIGMNSDSGSNKHIDNILSKYSTDSEDDTDEDKQGTVTESTTNINTEVKNVSDIKIDIKPKTENVTKQIENKENQHEIKKIKKN